MCGCLYTFAGPAPEQQNKKVIDLVAVDLPDLMRQLHVKDAPLMHYPPEGRVLEVDLLEHGQQAGE